MFSRAVGYCLKFTNILECYTPMGAYITSEIDTNKNKISDKRIYLGMPITYQQKTEERENPNNRQKTHRIRFLHQLVFPELDIVISTPSDKTPCINSSILIWNEYN
jgi:hypothetical protein